MTDSLGLRRWFCVLGKFHQGCEGLVDGGGDVEFGAAAGDVAVEGIDFGAFAALEVLGR
jgi:hypothetical protein